MSPHPTSNGAASAKAGPLDIAFLLGYPEISGGTNVIMEHALGLTRLGHRVSIVTEQPFDPQRLSWKPGAKELPLLSHADCRSHVFDLVLATWWRSVYDLPFVSARKHAYFVQSIESRFFPVDQPDMKALAEYTYRAPLPIVTEASWIKVHLERIYSRRCSLVLNGVDKATFNADGPVIEARPRGGMRVLVEGPLKVPFKRVELAVELCRRAGIDDLWLLTSSECESFPGVSRVFSKIPVTRVGEIYRSCDVLVKLSTVEGMFGPPLEMFHCGGTCVATDVTGHEEYLEHGTNGIVVKRGHESQVVDYLRALRGDQRFLEHLKKNALATAAKWPTWETSVKGMEAFCRRIVTEPVNEDLARHHAMTALRGALRLARPLREAAQADLSGKDLLRRAGRKAIAKLRRRAGLESGEPVEAAPNGGVVELKPLTPTVILHPSPPVSGLRVCFLGSPADEAYVPRAGTAVKSLFVPVRDGVRGDSLEMVRSFGPQAIVVFEAMRAADGLLDALRDQSVPILGHARRTLTPSRLAKLAASFPDRPGESGGVRVLTHLDSRCVAPLRAAGVACAGPLLLPIDLQGWGVAGEAASFAAWMGRSIPVLVLGSTNALSRSYLRTLEGVPGCVRVSGKEDPGTLRGLLADSKIAVHLPDGGDDPIGSPEVVRSMALGCLVASPKLRVDYGMLPDEHYLYYRDPVDLARTIRRVLSPADDMDVTRRTGWSRAQEFDATSWYASTLRDLGLAGNGPALSPELLPVEKPGMVSA